MRTLWQSPNGVHISEVLLYMCIYIYIYMYMCIYIYVYVYVYIFNI